MQTRWGRPGGVTRAGNQVCSRCHAGAEEGCFRREDFCRKIFTGDQAPKLKFEFLAEIHHPEKSAKVISDSGDGVGGNLVVLEKGHVMVGT